jgi:very-short-patch-repair endonuclease
MTQPFRQKFVKSPTESAAEFTLAAQWQADHLPPCEREFQFHPERKFRLDFAIPRIKFGVEIEGGLWVNGAHSRPSGILRDMEKGNLLTLLGWSTLRYSASQVRSGAAIREIAEYLDQVREQGRL